MRASWTARAKQAENAQASLKVLGRPALASSSPRVFTNLRPLSATCRQSPSSANLLKVSSSYSGYPSSPDDVCSVRCACGTLLFFS